MGVIKKQGLANSALTYFGIVLGLANILIIQPRLLSSTEIGLTRVMFAFSSIMAAFIPLGIGSITLRYFPHFNNPDKRHHGHFGLYLLFTSVGFLLISLCTILFKEPVINHYRENSPLFSSFYHYVLPFSLFISTTAIFTLYTSSIYKTTFSVLLNEIYNRIANILIIIGYYFKLYNFETFILLFVIIQLLQSVILLFYIISIDKISLKIDWKFVNKFSRKEVLSYGFLMMFTAFASMGIKLIDQAIMGGILPLNMVGIYSVGVFITAVMEAPINGIERIASAKIAEAWIEKNTEEIQKIYSDSCKYLFLLGGLLFAGLLLCTPYVFSFLPAEYAPGIQVAQIVGVASLINLATGVNSSILAYSNKYIYYSLLLFMLIILTVVCNYYFIPRYGINGAAFAMTLAGLVFNTLKTLVIYFRFHIHPFGTYTFKTILCIIVSIGLGYVLPETGIAWTDLLIKGSAITACYLSMAYSLKIVPEMHQYIPYLNKK